MSKAVNNKDDYYSAEIRAPPTETFSTFLYNPSAGTVLGRTGINWVKLLIFYVVFYIALAILCGICFWLFMLTISEDGPKWYLDESIIGTSPGLGYRPMNKVSEESTLIWYNTEEKNNHKNWTTGLDEFLKDYHAKVNESNVVECNYDKYPGKGKVCKVDTNRWYPCISSNKYDYPSGRPCVFIKLNKILNWVPDFYDDPDELPKKMPNDLKKYIEAKAKTDPKSLKTVWVSCEGEHPNDKENIGTIEYIPYRGFAGFYYPFTRVDNYLSPLVAIHFKSITRGILVNIECKAWAGNIMHDRRDRVGMVHFELMID